MKSDPAGLGCGPLCSYSCRGGTPGKQPVFFSLDGPRGDDFSSCGPSFEKAFKTDEGQFLMVKSRPQSPRWKGLRRPKGGYRLAPHSAQPSGPGSGAASSRKHTTLPQCPWHTVLAPAPAVLMLFTCPVPGPQAGQPQPDLAEDRERRMHTWSGPTEAQGSWCYPRSRPCLAGGCSGAWPLRHGAAAHSGCSLAWDQQRQTEVALGWSDRMVCR